MNNNVMKCKIKKYLNIFYKALNIFFLMFYFIQNN